MTDRKILHIFSTFAVGGPQRRFASLANAMPGQHHIITAMDGRYDAEASLQPSVSRELSQVKILKGKFLDPGNIFRLRDCISEHKPDVLCTYNWGAIEAVIAQRSWFSNAKPRHIHFEDGFGPDETLQEQNTKRVWARRLFLQSSQTVVPSRGLERLAVDLWRLPKANVSYVPNGIDVDQFTINPVPRSEEVVTLGFLGALRPEKNVGRLLKSFSEAGRFADLRLVIGGDGPDRSALEEYCVQLGIERKVEFRGHIAAPEQLYPELDVFCLSSDTEQMPLSLMEAMASGLPAVCTDVGDVSLMLADENRRFVVARDKEADFVEAICTLAGDRYVRERLGQLNREKAVREFSLGRMINRFEALYE